MENKAVDLETGLYEMAPDGKVKVLDVRPILRRREEPFAVIMDAVKGLGVGESLLLLATFEPKPLFEVMRSRGYDHQARERNDQDWEVLFTPQKAEV